MQDRGNASLPVDMVKILKTQDENYVRTMRTAGLKVCPVCCLLRMLPLTLPSHRKLRNSETALRNSQTSLLQASPMMCTNLRTMTVTLTKENLRSSGRQALLRGRPRLGINEDHHDLRQNILYSLRMSRKVCTNDLYWFGTWPYTTQHSNT